ncbi:A/G-specific adenine glycosylase [Legionella nagasakiensis]|uniref:A/G-specific adenine glycosylase n=1 Tax=Legionella nagasakiensis TaxID=535290 RepID=UPI00105699EE|nr:A/G-specific adenine glycosylase [Legionella nagasakiensis]
MNSQKIHEHFTIPLLTWFHHHGRKNLPWQKPGDAYAVWISEIMLQQTQVKTVIPYFLRFMDSFPNMHALAAAMEDHVLAHWSGLGYYSRARNLHKTAKIICNDFQGHFPEQVDALIKLPGIGPSTAAAITSLAFNKPTAILDGNVKRVLCRYFLIAGPIEQTAVNRQLWQLAQQCMPSHDCAAYTQAIMDLGATCCTIKNPNCANCPLHKTCRAYQTNKATSYPHKKLKKIKPVKEQQFLLMHTKNDLLYLEKQPPSGLWGSLWCMPRIDKTSCPVNHVLTTYGLETETMNELLTMKHTFSHFHLNIEAFSLQVKPLVNNSIAESPGHWFAVQDIKHLGLAKPIQVIINHFLTTKCHSKKQSDGLIT